MPTQCLQKWYQNIASQPFKQKGYGEILGGKVRKNIHNVKVMGFSGLLVDFVRANHAACIIRGARAVSDFDYEFQLAGMNLMLLPKVDTIFLTPAVQYQFVSGTIVREIGLMGGELDDFVSPPVKEALNKKRLERLSSQ